MTDAHLSPALSVVKASDLQPGDWAYVSIRNNQQQLDGLILLTDQKSPNPVQWALHFESGFIGFRSALLGPETVVRLDCLVRFVLPVADTWPAFARPRVLDGSMLVGITPAGPAFAATVTKYGGPACVSIDGTGMSETIPDESCWWRSGILEYRNTDETDWRLLARLGTTSSTDPESADSE